MTLKSRSEPDLQRWWNEEVRAEELSVAWLGQAGFLLKMGGRRIVIDPYLSDSLAEKYRGKKFPHIRMMPPPLKAHEIANADFVLCTHAHTDHMDPGTLPDLLKASPKSIVIVPRYSTTVAIERGVASEQLIGIDAGETIDFGTDTGLGIRALPAAHEDIEYDDFGNNKWLGFHIKAGNYSVYHSGDTIPNPELENALQSTGPINLALLPSNGRDEVRKSNGVPGNLTPDEAIDYHEKFDFKHTMLHHFGLFEFNTADPVALNSLVVKRDKLGQVTVPEAGKIYELET